MKKTTLSYLLFFIITIELFALALVYEITKYSHSQVLKFPLFIVGFQVLYILSYLLDKSDSYK